MNNSNIFVHNDLVKEYVSYYGQEKKAREGKDRVKNEILALGLGVGHYIYKGVENVTSCVTVYEQTKHEFVVREGNEEQYNSLQQQIDLLIEQQKALCDMVDKITICAKPNKMPKGINEMLKK